MSGDYQDESRLIQILAKADQDELITVYSLQSLAACDVLRKKASLFCNPDFVFQGDLASFRESGKFFAYDWMANQGSRRLGINTWRAGTLPIWCSLTPNKEDARDDDVCLTLNIPKRRLLPLFYDGWYQLLEIGYTVGTLPDWPSQWKSLVRPYLDPFSERRPKRDVTQPLPIAPPESDCRNSWEKMFDMSLINKPDLKWRRIVHLTTPYLNLTDVVS